MKTILGRASATLVSAALLLASSVVLAQNASINGIGNGNGNGNGNAGGNGNGNAGGNGNGRSTVARADNGRNKISADLDKVLNGRGNGREKWVKPSGRGSMVSIVILSNAKSDPDLKDLRRQIIAKGGTIGRKFKTINGVSALVPAERVREISTRNDVWRIAPNRTVWQASSMLEMATGTDSVRLTAGSGTLDGTGVGIAFLDSGIMSTHGALLANDGSSRVKLSVDFTSPLATLDTPVDTSGSLFQDPYGHGTLVASMAAGRNVPGGMESTGIAPGASLYDVRVLDDNGFGDTATVIAGIDWVVAHASQYGIKVLNISLGANSTDSYLTDPLCAAARNAVAAGITVVVAAGNYGQMNGTETYGTISAPGNEPSVITVGSSNPHGSAPRDDDSMNHFSSVGPTRGSYVDASGVTQHDNLIKPDLVAPGNRIVGALSTNRPGLIQADLPIAFPQLIVQASTAGQGLMLASGT
ncbi:MAG: S8 family serine peptidase, partial [Usitatibacter sp.]